MPIADAKTFGNDGYLHIKGVIKPKTIENFWTSFFDLYEFYSDTQITRDFDSPEFGTKLAEFRAANPDGLHALFRTIKHTIPFQNLFNGDDLIELVCKTIRADPKHVIIGEHQFRIDEPNDELYTLQWHQDAPYYPQSHAGKESIVVNICVQNGYENMGVPLLIKGSHSDGLIEEVRGDNKSKVTQKTIPSNYTENKAVSIVELKIGDVVIYDLNLIHRSGCNTSQKARFSILGRCFNPLSKHFTPYYYKDREFIET